MLVTMRKLKVATGMQLPDVPDADIVVIGSGYMEVRKGDHECSRSRNNKA